MAKRYDVVTLGETMIRLSPLGHARLEEATTLECRTGGSESNVAVALARLGLRVAWISRLPRNALGALIERRLRSLKVDTSHVLWAEGARAGVYFIEPGSLPRPTRVLYDRTGSAASGMSPEEMPWEVVRSARHLHLSGITPALSASCRAVTARAIAEAREAGASVSLDVNYRARLWSPEDAAAALSPLISGIDLLISTAVDLATLFGLDGEAEAVARAARARFDVGAVVVTLGGAGACLVSDGGVHQRECYPAVEVDRVGAGDAFDAGLLFGWLRGDPRAGLTYGLAMAALKHSMPGDEFIGSLAEVEELIAAVRGDIHR